jgi:hypothetical protein
MPSHAHASATVGTASSERTPLLAAPLHQVDPIPIQDEAVHETGEDGQEVPQLPELGKTLSRTEAEHLVRFQKNGLLEGVPTWRFRCVFGGILMGYFVGHISQQLNSRFADNTGRHV